MFVRSATLNLVGFIFIFCILAKAANAQVTTATIFGIVQDETGAMLPGATIRVRNLDTGVTRTAITDEQGRYHIPNLSLGNYEVQAELTGFQTEARSGITLTVRREAIVDFTLKVGEITEKVTVVGEAPLVDITTSQVSGLVDSRQIRNLPLNGRDFMQLALLQAGVTSIVNSNPAPDKGTGIRASFAGARPYQTGFLLDGTDISTRTNFRTPGSAAGVVLGVETVREFQVLVNSFSAEFGNAAGGVINAVSRSGTNEIHGSVFEFLRNSAFDARNFFDRGDSPPAFKRNQFGFTVGGPVKKDKIFYFGGYEGLRQRLGQTLIARVPTAAAREGRLPTGTVQVADSIKPYLALWPLPNGRDFGDGTAEFISSRSATTGENFWVVRTDFNLTDRDSLFVRFSFDDASTLIFPSPVPNIGTDQLSFYRYLTIEETKIFSPNSSNTFRFAFNRTRRTTEDHFFIKIDPSLYFIPGGRSFGSFTFGSNFAQTIHNPGASGRNPSDDVTNLFQYQDTFSLIRGSHSLKLGGMVNRYQLNDRSGSGDLGGQYQFNSFTDLLAGRPANLRITAPEAVIGRGFRQWLFGFFAQDDWKLRRDLTLNLGLRYEFITEVSEAHGRISALPDYRRGTQMVVGAPLFNNPSLKNFAPRVGFAWDVFGDGKTALRGGFGIFYDQIITNYFNQTADSNPPFSLRADIRNPIFPNALLALGTQTRTRPGPATVHIIDPDTHQPYMMQYNLSIQRALGDNNAVTVSYVGSRGVHLQREVLANPPLPIIRPDGRLFFPPNAERINPNFGNIFLRIQDGQSFFNSFQIKFDRRFSAHLQFQASYTFGKSVDDTSTSHGATDYGVIQVVQHPFDRKYDRGLSNFHVAHNFVANFTYEIPFVKGSNGLMGLLLRGWQFGGIANVSSGSPFFPIVGFDVANLRPTNNATRPNLAPGRDNNPVNPGNPDQYFDPTAFALQERGYLGNLGRNTLIGPGLVNFDFVLSRNFAVGERAGLQFRIEVFNVFNRANFANPSQIVVFDAAGPVRSAGRITSTVNASRQIQFGLKMTF